MRARLTLSGDLSTAATIPDVFDKALEQAVKTFQKRHMLTEDGIVGKNTLAAMNVPVEKRIDQIRVNLERFRWVSHQIPESFVVADLAGSEVYYTRQNEVVWQARAQVGVPCQEMPCFRADIRYMVINPTWTIPPKIVAEDILPALKRDSTYLKKRAIRVLNRHGDSIAPKSIKWTGYPERNFPYLLQQDSGPDNVLGRLKFVFPNPYRVTIHDRPGKSLFKASESGFSSGCIGVERPFEFAEFLAGDPDKWTPETLQAAAASKKTQTVFLPTAVPVLLLYLTAHVDVDGILIFKKDDYKRDAAVLKALESTFAFQPDWVETSEKR
jgi:murein L,D-transpeptidase YcbB/YkuD